MIYKIILKLLAGRLQPIIDAIIDKEQSAFTKNQLISNNILINHEVMHTLNQRKSSNDCGMAMNLDISKAYECIEWGFLQLMLRQFGFNDRWVSWIMAFVKTVSYYVQVNDHCIGEIYPSRGIR